MKKALCLILPVLVAFVIFSGCCVSLTTTSVAAGEEVYFGSWTASSSAEPLKWLVLSNTGGNLLLITEQIIDARAFDNSAGSWDSSGLKAWLNDLSSGFYGEAFTSVERTAINGGVRLLTLSEANSYFSSDSARAATTTTYAQAQGCSDNSWWLSTDSAAGNADAVDGSGAFVSGGIAKDTATVGIRPVILIDASAVTMILNDYTSTVQLYPDGSMHVVTPPSSPYALTIYDSSLPAVNVTGFIVEDGKLIVSCSTSAALSSGQKIFCYMYNSDGSSASLGWSSLSGGKCTFGIYAPQYTYTAKLMVSVPAAVNGGTSYSGPVSEISGIDCEKITGIEAGDHYAVGDVITFEASGYGTDNVSPEVNDDRWVPISWSVSGTSFGGTFSGAPYSSSLSITDEGSYTLTVTYTRQYYSGTEWTEFPSTDDQQRSVSFYVDKTLSLAAWPNTGICVGRSITLTPNIDGGTWSYDSSYLSLSGNTFTALKAGTVKATYTVYGQSASYTFAISEALTLSSSDTDGKIYTGGRITLTPNIGGGEWSYDSGYLSLSGNTFTALKAGTTTVTYTVGGVSEDYEITIAESVLPETGQRYTWAWVLAALALLAGTAVIALKRRTDMRAR